MSQALADPNDNRPMLRATRRGDDFRPGALAYWASLLHLLIYGLGWSRPDRGLHWWYDAGKPTNDSKLALIHDVWDTDGQLDWFAAWLWTTATCVYPEQELPVAADTRVAVDNAWLQRVEHQIADSRCLAPYGGGYDPLHLTGHIKGPITLTRSASVLSTSGTDPELFVLAVNSMSGWYRLLEKRRDVDSETAALKVEVVASTVGSLGIFQRSPRTGRWHSAQEHQHRAGN